MKTSKLLPANLDAERACLSACYASKEACGVVVNRLTAEHFAEDQHKKLYEWVHAQYSNGKEVNPVRASDDLGLPVEVCESAFESEYPASMAEDMCDTLQTIFLRRQVAMRAGELAKQAREGGVDILDMALGQLHAICELATGKMTDKTWKEHVGAAIDSVELALKGGVVTGLCTGLPSLDTLTGGLHAKELTVVAGGTSSGKTALGLQMAHVNLLHNIPVAIYSLEMGGDELAKRLFARESGVDGITIRNGRLVGNQLDRITAACVRVAQMPLFVRDRPDMSISQIRADARRMHAAHGVKLIVVDYIQLVAPDKTHDSREREVASISRGLKQMAKELGVPVIALSQTNKQGELRESAAIGQDSDVVISILESEDDSTRTVRVEKNRHGARKVNIAVSFDGAHGVITETGGEKK